LNKRIRRALGSGVLAIGTLIFCRNLLQKRRKVAHVVSSDEIPVSRRNSLTDDLELSREAWDELVSRLESSFRDVYLQLLSIIQGVAFGFLATITLSRRSSLNAVEWWALLASLVLVLTVWQDYMVGSTAFAWIPTLLDTIIPFGLGVAEFAMIAFAVGPTRDFLIVFPCRSVESDSM